MNILNSYKHIRPKKVKYPIPEIPDDSGKKSFTDWVLPKIIGSGRVSGTRQVLFVFGQVFVFVFGQVFVFVVGQVFVFGQVFVWTDMDTFVFDQGPLKFRA